MVSDYSSSEDYTESITSSEDDNKYNLHNLKGDILNKYNIIEEIGRGGYSIVWLGFNIQNNNFYAIKVQNSDDYEEGLDEIRIIKKLNHKNITKLVDYFIEKRYDNNNELQKYICSVYELCCGNLDGLARKGKYKNGYPENIVFKFYNQIYDGLDYLHNELKILHGDIKPDNILLKGVNNRDKILIDFYKSQNFNDKYSKIKKTYWKEKGNNEKNIKKMKPEVKIKIRKSIHKKIIEDMKSLDINEDNKYFCNQDYFENPEIVITDFGNYCPDEEQFNESFGTTYYQAPEILLKGDCTKKVDIWALGCTLYEFLKGKILFDPKETNSQTEKQNHLEMMINYCGDFNKNFLRNCELNKKYFDKKSRFLNGDTSNKKIMIEYLNEILEIENKERWVNILDKMIRLNPRERKITKIN
jgi:serine/threonine-protein kinase SRPK3